MDTIAAVEKVARKLPPLDASDLRGRICGFLTHAKLPRSNLTKDQRAALKELEELKDEVILPAEKGNVTAVMMKCDYKDKMEGLLKTNTYSKLRKDPTSNQEICLTQTKGIGKEWSNLECTLQ